MTKYHLPVNVVFLMFLIGCAGKQTYTGTLSSCFGEPISNVKIEAWKNKWMPMHLPEKLGEAKTNESGEFMLKTSKKASFFVYPKGEIEVLSHPRKSESKCE